MPDKEQFRKQVQIGVDYAVESELDEEQMVAHLTDHLWGTVGMWLQARDIETSKMIDKLYKKIHSK